MTGEPDRRTLEPVWEWFDRVDPRAFPLVFYGFLLVWIGALLVVSWEWAWRDKLVAYLAGVPTLAFIVVTMVKVYSPETYDRLTFFLPEAEVSVGDDGEASDLREAYESIRDTDDVGRPRSERIAYGVRITVWAMTLPVLMYTLGFANALVLFVFAFGLRFYDTVRETVVVTVVFSVLMYLFFWEIIGMSPWTGTLGLPSVVDLLGLG